MFCTFNSDLLPHRIVWMIAFRYLTCRNYAPLPHTHTHTSFVKFPISGLWQIHTPAKGPERSCIAYVLWFNRAPHVIKGCGGVKHPYSLRHAWLASVCLGAALHSEVHGNCFLSKWLTALFSFLITVAIIMLFMSLCCAYIIYMVFSVVTCHLE